MKSLGKSHGIVCFDLLHWFPVVAHLWGTRFVFFDDSRHVLVLRQSPFREPTFGLDASHWLIYSVRNKEATEQQAKLEGLLSPAFSYFLVLQ